MITDYPQKCAHGYLCQEMPSYGRRYGGRYTRAIPLNCPVCKGYPATLPRVLSSKLASRREPVDDKEEVPLTPTLLLSAAGGSW